MIKRLRVTVDGHSYDVTVEVPDGSNSPAAPVTPAAPTPPPAVVPTAPVPAAPAAPVAAAPSSSTGPGEVPSPLAGRVTAVMVTVGQEVKEGDHLVTLEAMKMNTFVFAPKNGKVTKINTAVGSAVEEGQSLARID